MRRASQLTKIISIFAIIITLSSFFPQVSQSSFQTKFIVTAPEEAIPSPDILDLPIDINEDIYDSLISPNTINESANVFGEAIRITNEKLQEDQYVVVHGPNETTHCVWFQQLTHVGLSIMYSYTNDSIDWSTPEPIFRLYTDVEIPQLLIDDTGGIHLVFYAYRQDQFRLYYFQSQMYNLTFTHEVIYDSVVYEIDELTLALTHNDTLNIVYKAQTKESTTVEWDSHIGIARYNVSTGLELSQPWILFNESDPMHIGVGSTYDSLRICWGRSSNYDLEDADYYLIYSEYNETTTSWNAHSEILTTENKLYGIFLTPKASGGNYILWIDKPKYYTQNFGELKENETLVNIFTEINEYKTNSYSASVFEDTDTNNLYLAYEEKYGLDDNVYGRIYFASNSSWSAGFLLSTNDHTTNPDIYYYQGHPTLIAVLYYLSDGSIVSRNFTKALGLTDETIIYFGGNNFLFQSVVTDSEGTLHMICSHQNRAIDEIVYQKKLVNGTYWIDFSTVTNEIVDVTNTNLLIDENDTLYAFFVSYDHVTERSGLFMSLKYKHQLNWSAPKLLFTPNKYVNAYEETSIFFDDDSNIHAFWVQYNQYAENYEIGYAMKPISEENFTSPTSLPTYQEESHNYQIDAGIDGDGRLHLVNVEYSESFQVTSIIYRSKDVGEDWTDPLIVFASYNLLARPMIFVDENGDIELIITDSIVISQWHSIYDTDFRFLSKVKGGSWVDHGIFLYETGSARYFDIIEVGEELYLVYYELDPLINYWWATTLDYMKVIKRNAVGQWVDDQTIFYQTMDKALPVVTYNNVSKEVSILFEMTSYINCILLQNDTDLDGLGDTDELFYNSDIFNPDTDSDGLLDGFEVKNNATNPMLFDTDWDDLNDGDEVLIHKSDPLKSDTDRDNLRDGDEVNLYGSDPTTRDSDKDLLTDDMEILVLGSSPINIDTDGDGMDDFFEYTNSLLILIDDSLGDPDADNLTNIGEYLEGTGIYTPDTDLDLLSDGTEVNDYGTNPLDADTDTDTLTDWEELMKYHTSPFLEDTDEDGFSDRDEIHAGTDPNDPNDNIQSKQLRIILIASIVPGVSLVTLIVVIEARFRMKTKKQIEAERHEIKEAEDYLDEVRNNNGH